MHPGQIGEIPGTGGGGLGPGTPPAGSGIVPPTVEAGGPYSGEKDVAVQLDATVTPGSDPSPTNLWTIVSGGTGTFSDDTAEDPTFTPDNNGNYVLRLTVTPSDTSAVSDDANLSVSVDVVDTSITEGGGAIGRPSSYRRKRRQELEQEDEEILAIIHTLAPEIMKHYENQAIY